MGIAVLHGPAGHLEPTWDAATTGSMERWGMAACPPRPVMFTQKRSAAAMMVLSCKCSAQQCSTIHCPIKTHDPHHALPIPVLPSWICYILECKTCISTVHLS